MVQLAEYGQGSTIGFYVQGDSNIDFDANDFKVLFKNDVNTQKVLIEKADFVQVEANKYYGEIANTITKDLAPTIYTMEILFGETKTSIKKVNAFKIFKTSIKLEL